MLLDADGRLLHEFPSNHLAFGIVGGDDFYPELQIFRHDRPATLYLYSDGLSEMLAHGSNFTDAELLALFAHQGQTGSLAHIDQAIQRVPVEKRHDDATVLAVSYAPSGAMPSGTAPPPPTGRFAHTDGGDSGLKLAVHRPYQR